ncbi:metal-dependent transcriptional regulator [Halovenus rubra]|uniref:Metal-dependent transcriptional regulator n=2 Tax=Halovenus rubra TaxID=869890 RepID=A0ABD5X3H6_9EURY|nr:metal-dependent transcriptional regulator [Halovenus rubra]
MNKPNQRSADGHEDGVTITPKMEDYLRRIYRLQQESEGRVSNSNLAETLDVTRATVTSMLDTLSSRGLIDWQRYRPVRLTAKGEATALQVLRRHRLVETMLAELFGYALSEVDAEADVLEHHISSRLCQTIEQELGMPQTDPHGDPIPDSDLDIDRTTDVSSLPTVAESSTVEVTRLLSQDEEILEYLVSLGIEPGKTLSLDEITPIGMITVTVESTARQANLPRRIASHVLVK